MSSSETGAPNAVLRKTLFYSVLVALGTAFPLTDPDLPLHLLIGEWIATHRAVPTVEPFAWTRAGEPYFAYSWLPELIFYAGERAGGATLLKFIHGVLMAGAAWAMLRLARAAAWPPAVTLVMVPLHLAAFGLAVPSLRPQGVLFITVPLVWAAMHRLLVVPDCRRSLAVLLASSVVSAASHIFFPLTLVPLVGFWVGRAPLKTALLAGLAIVAGWVVSPYGLLWPKVFALNFSPNPLLGPGSPIAELTAGFASGGAPGLFVAVVAVAIVWGVLRRPFSGRARIVALLLCVVGVALFAYAARLMAVFWLLAAPVAGHVLLLSMERENRLIVMRTAGASALVFLFASILQPRHVLAWAEEGFASSSLASPEYARVRPVLLQWECAARRPERARIFTRLEYANVLAWRLRPHSLSVDSRTIFPDSVAMGELHRDPQAGRPAPWLSADAAILDRFDPVGITLDSARGWMPVPRAVAGDLRAPLIWLNMSRFDFGPLPALYTCAASVE